MDTNPGLVGTLPSQLGLLTALTTLHLGDLSLEQTIPTQIGRLSNALSIILHENSLLSGLVPSQLGLLTQLTRLFLQDTNVTGAIPQSLCDDDSVIVGEEEGPPTTSIHLDCELVDCGCGDDTCICT